MTDNFLGPRLPWSSDPAGERRFKAILVAILLPAVLATVVLPYLPLFELPEEEEPQIPPRLVELVIEQREPPPPPPPPPPPEPVEEPPPPPPEPVPEEVVEPQPEPVPQQTPEASENRARKAGVMAFADSLQALTNTQTSVTSQRDLSAGVAANTSTRRLITSNLGEGSTGIRSQVGAPGELGGGSTQLAGRSTVQVQGPPGGGPVAGGSGRAGAGSSASRTIESIQVTFDRNKSGLFSIYQRALRSHPGMSGTVVLRLEIQPSGEVSSVSIVSSELDAPELEAKLVNRVQLMNFGAKNVPVWRGPYPIRFYPS